MHNNPISKVTLGLLIYLLLQFIPSLVKGQSISLQALVELNYQKQKGNLKIPYSNRGQDPLRITSVQSSHSSIQVTTPKKPIKPTTMGFIEIRYDFTKIPKNQLKAIILQINDVNRPKITIQFVE